MSAAKRNSPTPSEAEANAAYAERQRGLYAAVLEAAAAERLSPEEREAVVTALIALEIPALYSGQEEEPVPALDSRFFKDGPLLWARWIRPRLEAASDAELQAHCIAVLMREAETGRMWEERRALTAMEMSALAKKRHSRTEEGRAAIRAAARHLRSRDLNSKQALRELENAPFNHDQIIVQAHADRVSAYDNDGKQITSLTQKWFVNKVWPSAR